MRMLVGNTTCDTSERQVEWIVGGEVTDIQPGQGRSAAARTELSISRWTRPSSNCLMVVHHFDEPGGARLFCLDGTPPNPEFGTLGDDGDVKYEDLKIIARRGIRNLERLPGQQLSGSRRSNENCATTVHVALR